MNQHSLSRHTTPVLRAHLSRGDTPATPLRGLAQRHPIALFLLWFFTIGQLIAFTPRIVQLVSSADLPTEPFVIASTYIGLLLPVALITWALDGRIGLHDLFARSFRWRIGPRWYALPLLAVPAGVVGLQAMEHGLPPWTGTATAAVEVVTHFLAPLVVVLVTVNLAEEVAWTGFLQARLQSTGRAPIVATLAVTPLFALQHISLGPGDPTAMAVFLLLLTLLALPFRALQSWLFNRTDSLLLVGLVHAAGNASALGSLGIEGLTPTWYGTAGQSLLVFAALGLLVLAFTRARLGLRTSPPREHPHTG